MERDMIGKIPRSFGLMLAALAVMAIGASTASAASVYSNLPKPQPKNVVSLAFEATSTSEFGGAVKAAGSMRNNATISTVLSSWACEEGTGVNCHTTGHATFNWPITLKVYEAGPANTVGALVEEKTQTFAIPYRPSANNHLCTPNSEGAVGYSAECFHGKTDKITFSAMSKPLPNEAILAIAYNTTNYGASPQGPQPCSAFIPSRCAYDSLNVGLEEGQGASPGEQPTPASAYLSSTWSGAYCDGGAGGTGTFRFDEGCWGGEQPLFMVKASR
jgi:hypothetical protein